MENKKDNPKWLLPRGMVDEIDFCEEFYTKHHIIFQDGAFFSVEGRLTEDRVRNMIFRELRPYVRSCVGTRVESCLRTLEMEAQQNALKADICEDIMTLHAANGTYRLDTGTFSPVKHLTRFRLAVDYNPAAPEPERWLAFVKELLHEEDIPTLQEYLGYCLIPCTLGQKMLIITGKGGEGKSRIGVVLKALLGCNMHLNSIAKIEKSPFARADLEHLLLMVDDDLKMEALDQTNYIKSIITAELPMDLEKKGIQSYQGQLQCRFLAFGNGNLRALHDRSYGFFRRQVILEAREKDPKRKDDPYLGFALTREAEGILLWCIQGLERLILNDFKFTMSRRARENLLRSMSSSNNIPEFLTSSGYIRFDPSARTTSRALYETYKDWCSDNAYNALSGNSFWSFLNQNVSTYHLIASSNIDNGNNRRVRGYIGIGLCSRF